MFVKDFIDEYERYRATGDKAMSQVSDEALNQIVAPNGNSIAMIVRHVSGNFVSRFSSFLTEDGEKPWRNRDDEFADGPFTRAEVEVAWRAGWQAVLSELGRLTDADLERVVTIRGQDLSVHAALCRSLAHVAMHVGQIVVLARVLAHEEWRWITIPKGQSQQYNQNPILEKRPAS